jgi:NNP family nitrate/nitrite transporter-like MFS transporter
LQAASAACLFPVGFTMLALVFPAHMRGLAVSLIIFISFIAGGGLVPSGIGYWAEAFSFSSGFMMMGIFFLVMLPVFLRVSSRLDLSK